jgi:hypothetical protein
LDAAEAALIARLDPRTNRQGKGRYPADCVVIYSRFWGGENEDEQCETPAGFPSPNRVRQPYHSMECGRQCSGPGHEVGGISSGHEVP